MCKKAQINLTKVKMNVVSTILIIEGGSKLLTVPTLPILSSYLLKPIINEQKAYILPHGSNVFQKIATSFKPNHCYHQHFAYSLLPYA